MELVKVINLDNKITLKMESFNKNVFFYFNNKKKVVLKFTFNNEFFLKTGTLTVLCKKNQVFLLGEDSTEIFNFMSNIKRVKKSNFYKGKGILQFKNFKFTKLKIGKKQRFM